MRYPLLLMELLGATPEGHHDHAQLSQALLAVKEINVNINEYKRRKDLGTSGGGLGVAGLGVARLGVARLGVARLGVARLL